MATPKRFTQRGKAPGHHNYTLTLTPTEGPNAGTGFVFDVSAYDMSTGGGVSYVAGNQINPIAIVANAAEPTVGFTIANAAEGDSLIAHIGGSLQDTHCTATWVRKRSGLPTLTWTVIDFLAESWDFSSESGSAPGWEVSGGCTDVLFAEGSAKPISIIAKAA